MPSNFFFFVLSWQGKEKTCNICHYCKGVVDFALFPSNCQDTKKCKHKKERRLIKDSECSTCIVLKNFVFRKFCYKVKAGGELGEIHWLFFKLVVYFAWMFDSAMDRNICALWVFVVSRSVWFSGYSNPVQKLLC